MATTLQQALIVDDSKTARVALRKMLERFQIQASLVESGEDALVFLQHHSPDIIFMDHMMPGMDGFTAVKAIKSDPHTADIPIVMHTSKQGEIYAGQARALGAMALLPKPATDGELQAVLERLAQRAPESTPDSRERIADSDVFAVTTIEDAEPDTGAIPAGSGAYTAVLADTIELDARAVARAAETAVEQRRGLSVNRSAATDARRPGVKVTGDVGGPFWGSLRQWLLALIWLVPIAWLLWLYLPVQHEVQTLNRQHRAYLETAEWLLNQRESYDFGEAPLADNLLTLLQGLVPRLASAGFTGVIRLEGHIGEFCLSRLPLSDGTEIAMLPEPDLPLTACTMIGYSQARAARESIASSPAFDEYLTRAGLQQPDAPIRVKIVALGSSRPRYIYPEDLESLTTGDWNAVALRNNRVHIELVAD